MDENARRRSGRQTSAEIAKPQPLAARPSTTAAMELAIGDADKLPSARGTAKSPRSSKSPRKPAKPPPELPLGDGSSPASPSADSPSPDKPSTTTGTTPRGTKPPRALAVHKPPKHQFRVALMQGHEVQKKTSLEAFQERIEEAKKDLFMTKKKKIDRPKKSVEQINAELAAAYGCSGGDMKSKMGYDRPGWSGGLPIGWIEPSGFKGGSTPPLSARLPSTSPLSARGQPSPPLSARRAGPGSPAAAFAQPQATGGYTPPQSPIGPCALSMSAPSPAPLRLPPAPAASRQPAYAPSSAAPPPSSALAPKAALPKDPKEQKKKGGGAPSASFSPAAAAQAKSREAKIKRPPGYGDFHIEYDDEGGVLMDPIVEKTFASVEVEHRVSLGVSPRQSMQAEVDAGKRSAVEEYDEWAACCGPCYYVNRVCGTPRFWKLRQAELNLLVRGCCGGILDGCGPCFTATFTGIAYILALATLGGIGYAVYKGAPLMHSLLVELRQHVALFLACAFGMTALLCLLAWVYLRPSSSQSENERTASSSQGSSRQGVSLKQTLMQNLFAANPEAEARYFQRLKEEADNDFLFLVDEASSDDDGDIEAPPPSTPVRLGYSPTFPYDTPLGSVWDNDGSSVDIRVSVPKIGKYPTVSLSFDVEALAEKAGYEMQDASSPWKRIKNDETLNSKLEAMHLEVERTLNARANRLAERLEINVKRWEQIGYKVRERVWEEEEAAEIAAVEAASPPKSPEVSVHGGSAASDSSAAASSGPLQWLFRLLSLLIFTADVLSDFVVAYLLFATGYTLYTLCVGLLIATHYLLTYARLLDRLTYEEEYGIHRCFRDLGPLGVILLDTLSLFSPFGLVTLLVHTGCLSQTIANLLTDYMPSRLALTAWCSSLPQAVLQAAVLYITLQQGAAEVVPPLLAHDMAPALPLSIGLSLLAVLSSWVALLHTARNGQEGTLGSAVSAVWRMRA